MTRPIAGLSNPDLISFRPPCCVYPPNVVTPIVSTVFANGRPRAKAGDVLTPAPGFPTCKSPCPPLPRAVIAVSKAFINGRPSAHVGDLTNPVSPRIIGMFPTNIFVN
jgi:uncharacterized Zn-binding protein involved in type VI secretion